MTYTHRLCDCGQIAASRSPLCYACLVRSEPTRKLHHSPYVEGFDKGLDEGEWRALLTRDIADVERYILDCQSFFTPTWQGSWERVHIRDCEAWLTRARAALS